MKTSTEVVSKNTAHNATKDKKCNRRLRNVTAVYEKCKTCYEFYDLDLKLREVLPNSTCTVKVL